jgi:hypothetical protein
MAVEYETDADKQGRPRAVNVRVERDGEPYLWRPGEARVYQTRQLYAEQPVEFESSALRRDRERHRDLRTRRDRRAQAERLFTIPGADGV